jgi:hypothetical protein
MGGDNLWYLDQPRPLVRVKWGMTADLPIERDVRSYTYYRSLYTSTTQVPQAIYYDVGAVGGLPDFCVVFLQRKRVGMQHVRWRDSRTGNTERARAMVVLSRGECIWSAASRA